VSSEALSFHACHHLDLIDTANKIINVSSSKFYDFRKVNKTTKLNGVLILTVLCINDEHFISPTVKLNGFTVSTDACCVWLTALLPQTL